MAITVSPITDEVQQTTNGYKDDPEKAASSSNGAHLSSEKHDFDYYDPSLDPTPVEVPYRAIFEPNLIQLESFPISVDVSYEEQRTLLTTYVYQIKLKQGDFEWTLKKRFSQISNFHDKLRIFIISYNIPYMHNKEEKETLKNENLHFPFFRFFTQGFVTENAENRKNLIQDFLEFCLSHKFIREQSFVQHFLQISPYSFIKDLGMKGEEWLVQKRAGGFRTATYFTKIENFFTTITGHWRKRWLVVKESSSCIFYINPKDRKIRYVMLFDNSFSADSGVKHIGVPSGVKICNMSRQLVLRCFQPKEAKDLAEYLREVAKNNASDFVNANPHDSYAPIRESVQAQWFVDGSAHFEAVLQAIELAEDEIFIADWWLSPEIYLKRPSLTNQSRLDRVLLRSAEKGVKIFILLYKEIELGISINSAYTKHTLMKMHPNIAVLRDPDTIRGGPLLWSHHEKLVIIDQKWAFVGGIDLCFGRWDNYSHKLIDLGGINLPPTEDERFFNSTKPTGLLYKSCSQPVLPAIASPDSSLEANTAITLESEVVTTDGIVVSKSKAMLECIQKQLSQIEEINEVSNEIVKPSKSGNNSRRASRASNKSGRFRAFQAVRSGNLRSRLSRNIRNKKIAAIARLRSFKSRIDPDRISCNSEDLSRENTPDFIHQSVPHVGGYEDISAADLEGSSKLWVGKDYTNFIVKDFVNLESPYQDLINRNNTPRMPWHDVSCMVIGAAARDVARHFIQRWNATKFSKAKFNERYSWLVPRTYANASQVPVPPFLIRPCTVNCQALRSIGPWSAGANTSEASIVDAYITAINNAEQYIYIENQFFISSTRTHSSEADMVKNRIAEAILRRIMRAHHNHQTFRVYVLIPLLPAFEGEIGTSSGTPIQQITHYNYSTICKGPDSIISKLERNKIDPTQYIGFYGLRNYDLLNGHLVTELIYVHSKILIVDDRTTIIGSANINDRSMLGSRDSEVAVIIEDKEFDTTNIDGKIFKSGRFAGSLRRMLMCEHLGIHKSASIESRLKFDSVLDPVSDRFWKDIWNATAQSNSIIYEQVFAVIPTDEIRRFSDMNKYLEKPKLCKVDKEKAIERLNSVQGHLVCLPLKFLIDERDPVSNPTAQDRFLPNIIYT